MSTLREHFDKYFAVRRNLGAKLHESEAMLRQFVDFAEQEGAEWVTTEIARRWACQIEDIFLARRARRLSAVRLFAQYLSAHEPRTEIPPKGLLRHSYSRAT
jgi:integrase/recombinase XerD